MNEKRFAVYLTFDVFNYYNDYSKSFFLPFNSLVALALQNFLTEYNFYNNYFLGDFPLEESFKKYVAIYEKKCNIAKSSDCLKSVLISARPVFNLCAVKNDLKLCYLLGAILNRYMEKDTLSGLSTLYRLTSKRRTETYEFWKSDNKTKKLDEISSSMLSDYKSFIEYVKKRR